MCVYLSLCALVQEIGAIPAVCGSDDKKRKRRQHLLNGALLSRAEGGTRTRDLRITNASLYQLSYFGIAAAKVRFFFEPKKKNGVFFRPFGIFTFSLPAYLFSRAHSQPSFVTH